MILIQGCSIPLSPRSPVQTQLPPHECLFSFLLLVNIIADLCTNVTAPHHIAQLSGWLSSRPGEQQIGLSDFEALWSSGRGPASWFYKQIGIDEGVPLAKVRCCTSGDCALNLPSGRFCTLFDHPDFTYSCRCVTTWSSWRSPRWIQRTYRGKLSLPPMPPLFAEDRRKLGFRDRRKYA